MSAWNPRPLLVVTAIALMAAPLGRPAAAQERPGPAGEFAAGALLFADDGVVTEGFVGGAARLYVLPRISVGPEIAYIQGENHSHLMLTGNVTFDLVRPVHGQPRQITAFAVVGGGLFRTREPFPNNEVFTSSAGKRRRSTSMRTKSDRTRRPFVLGEAIGILARTPVMLDAMLRGLPEAWIVAHEGRET